MFQIDEGARQNDTDKIYQQMAAKARLEANPQF